MKRRAMLAVGLFAVMLVRVAQAQHNEAEKLFRDMERKIASAKTIQVDFTYQLEGKSTTGSLLLTADNKARLRVRGVFSFEVKREVSFELVSDGKKLELKGARLVGGSTGRSVFKLGGQTELETPRAFHAWRAAEVCRVGLAVMVIGLPATLGAEADPDGEETRMKVRDFKMGSAEKVGERWTKVIHYRCGKGGNDDPKSTVWIEAKTGLPLKRVSLIHPESERIRITETYGKFKLDAEDFQLP